MYALSHRVKISKRSDETDITSYTCDLLYGKVSVGDEKDTAWWFAIKLCILFRSTPAKTKT